VAGRRQLPLLRAGGVKAVCEHVAGDTPYFSTFASATSGRCSPRSSRSRRSTGTRLEETPDCAGRGRRLRRAEGRGRGRSASRALRRSDDLIF
jgi:hypothetical protein